MPLLAGCGPAIADYEPLQVPWSDERVEPETPPAEPANAPARANRVLRLPKITLEQAIEEALAQAPDILAGGEAVIQARADLKTAHAYPNPQLTVGTTLQPAPGTHFSSDNPGGPPQYTFDLAIQLDPLLFGKWNASKESARRAVDVAGADYADLKRMRAGDVASAFYDLLAAQRLLALVREDVENLKRIESLTKRRVELGGSADVDLDRARLAVATATQDVRNAEIVEATARATLRSLLGRGDAEPTFDVTGSLEVPNPIPAPDLETVLASADRSRPDLVSLRRQVSRWIAEAQSQSRLALPQLTLSAGYLYQNQSVVGGANFNEVEGFVAVTLPLFDRNQGNIAKAESQARQAKYSYDSKRAGVRAELTRDIAGFKAACAALVAEDKTQLEAAKSVRDRMEAAYQGGGRTLLEALDAERAYRDAQRFHAGIQSAYWHAFYEINRASGTAFLK